LEVVGGGALGDYGCGGGGAAVDGEEEAAVGDSGVGEGNLCGGVGVVLARVRVPLRAPRVVGVKVMVTGQLEPGVRIVVEQGAVTA
jgi:hypothetical protein